MDIDRIEAKIEYALEHERDTGTFREAVLRRLVKEEQLDAALKGVIGYVRLVPLLLREAQKRAKRHGIPAFEPILAEAASYWELEKDVLPDFLGLMGVLDDAYHSLSLLQGLSNHCESESGTPLLPHDLTDANRKMRGFMPQGTASELDTLVAAKLGAVTASNTFAAFLQAFAGMGSAMGPGRDPIWGSATTEEIANARLGAMGIV